MGKERIIKAFIKKWWLILIVVLVSTGSSFYIVNTSKPIYQSTTTLYVMPTTNSQKPIITSDNIAVSQQLIKDYSDLIKSEKITSEVLQRLGINDIDTEELSTNVSIDIVKGSDVFRLSFDDTNPEKAQAIANAFTQVLTEKVIEMNNQIKLNIVDEAKLPIQPMSTNKTSKVIISFFISLIAICGLIVLLEYIDNKVCNVQDVEKELGYSVIGIIPEMDIK